MPIDPPSRFAIPFLVLVAICAVGACAARNSQGQTGGAMYAETEPLPPVEVETAETADAGVWLEMKAAGLIASQCTASPCSGGIDTCAPLDTNHCARPVRGIGELQVELRRSGILLPALSPGVDESARSCGIVAAYVEVKNVAYTVQCTGRDNAANQAVEAIGARTDDWEKRFEPGRLSLRGSEPGSSVAFWLEANTVALVLPHLRSASIAVDGAAAVPVELTLSSAAAKDLDGDGVTEIYVRASQEELRRAVSAAVRMGQTPVGVPVPVRLLVGQRTVVEQMVVVERR